MARQQVKHLRPVTRYCAAGRRPVSTPWAWPAAGAGRTADRRDERHNHRCNDRCGSNAVLYALLLTVAMSGCGNGNPTAVSGPAPAPGPAPVMPMPPAPTPTPPLMPDPTPAPGIETPQQPEPPPGDTPSTYSVQGVLSLSESNSLDSDTNDPNQVGRTSNNLLSGAQAISSPTTLIGYLNVAGQGPTGPSFAGGDMFDRYELALRAGQVVELEFAADPSAIDVDLYIYDVGRDDNSDGVPDLVGRSQGTRSYECVRITRDGNYKVSASLYQPASRGGTVYQMRIGAPGTGTSCTTETNLAVATIPGEVFVQAHRYQYAPADSKGAPAQSPVVLKGSLIAGGSAVVAVPPDLAAWQNRAPKAAAITGIGPPENKSPHTLALERTLLFAKMLNQSGQYRFAMPNLRLTGLQSIAAGAFPPNDREYPKQRWHYEAIELPAAIERISGLPELPLQRPVVAVLDTGVVAGHPDLSNQLLAGYDFVRTLVDAGDGDGIDPDPDDPSGVGASFHGSHVAGIVGAETFNDRGGAGVAPMARILPVRVLDINGGGDFYDIDQGLKFALGQPNDSGLSPTRPADVVNMSLGAQSDCSGATAEYFRALANDGAILVVSAGNDSVAGAQPSPLLFPANCDGVLAVGATNAQNERAFYSNVGPGLALVAPGGDITQSTTGSGLPDGIFSTVAAFDQDLRIPSYSILMGTSMAAPHASGVFALMKYLAPQINQRQIEMWLSQSRLTVDIGTPGHDAQTGWGLLSASKSVEQALALSQGRVPPPPTGAIEALPSSLSLGAFRQQVEFELRAIGQVDDAVVAISADSDAIAISPVTVDQVSGLGKYRVSANRDNLESGQTLFAEVVVSLRSGTMITVPVTIQRAPAGAGTAGGNLGPIHVLILDADAADSEPVARGLVAEPTDGAYRYLVSSVPGTGRITVMAGSDTDNDGAICSTGEACGAFPVFGNQSEVLQPRSDLTGINFPIAPFGGIASQGIAIGTGSRATDKP